MSPEKGNEFHWETLYRLGAVAAVIFLVYSLVTMVQLFTIGGQPETVEQIFNLLQENRLLGLLRLDGLTLLALPLYYLIYLGLFIGLLKRHTAYAVLGTILVVAGVTLVLATPTAFSLVPLSDKFAAATSATEREHFLAAGEALIASNMWQGSGAMLGRTVMLAGGLLGSVLTLRSTSFSKATAYSGIIAHGLDLVHSLGAFLIIPGGFILMAIAGTLYLFWFPLLAMDLGRLARGHKK
jgi:hypothetical protein